MLSEKMMRKQRLDQNSKNVIKKNERDNKDNIYV